VLQESENLHKSSNNTGAETDCGPLALKTIIKHTPCDTSDAGSQVSNNCGHDSTHVGSESGTSIESEPTNPEEDSPDDNVCHVVGAVVQLMGAMSSALAQHDGVRESCRSGRDVHWGSTGEVKTTHLVDPSLRVPCPARNWIIDEGGPDKHEDNGRQLMKELAGEFWIERKDFGNVLQAGEDWEEKGSLEATYHASSLCDSTDSKCNSDGCKHALVDSEEEVGNPRGTDRWSCQHISETNILKVTKKLARSMGESQ
jgi:hypothetical protein